MKPLQNNDGMNSKDAKIQKEMSIRKGAINWLYGFVKKLVSYLSLKCNVH